MSKPFAHVDIVERDRECLEHLADTAQENTKLKSPENEPPTENEPPVEKDAELKKGEVNTAAKGFGSQALPKQKGGLHLETRKKHLFYISFRKCLHIDNKKVILLLLPLPLERSH